MARIFRKTGIVVSVLVAVGAIGWFWRWHIAYGVVAPLMLGPSSDIEETAFVGLNYTDDANWVALPWRANDPSDRMPSEVSGDAATGDADVFYIHPTTYLSADAWNVPPEGMNQTPLLEDVVLRDQPNAFSACCRVFAPYYQQATFYAFMDSKGNGVAALDRAYQDVRAAFWHFVSEWSEDRPFIIAAHSQGSLYAQRLMEEEIVGTDLERRLVVAYVPGYQLPVEPPAPVCSHAEQTGCLMSWNNVTAPYWLPDFMYDLPLTGEGGFSRVAQGEFVCAPPAPDAGEHYSAYHAGDNELSPSTLSGECVDGHFIIDDPIDPNYAAFPMSRGWWHVYEYAHMWVAIGEDAERRIGAHASD